jgi:hypothetical protein
MGDWLGNGRIATHRRQYRTFDEARIYVQGFHLTGRSAWRRFIKSEQLPPDIPAKPEHVYAKQGWRGWGDWFGTGALATSQRRYRPFAEAREFVQGLRLGSKREWEEYTRSGELPTDIPRVPRIVYQNEGWSGIGDWLGTGRIGKH